MGAVPVVHEFLLARGPGQPRRPGMLMCTRTWPAITLRTPYSLNDQRTELVNERAIRSHHDHKTMILA